MRSGDAVRGTTTLPRALGVALILGAAAGCYGESTAVISGVPPPPGAARIEVLYDPARAAPSDCTVLRFSYVASRTGDAAGAPPGSVSDGLTSSDDRGRDVWCPGIERFAFPDRFELKQGTWDFSLRVTEDESGGALHFESTCSGVPIRSGTVHVILITQPRAGTSATCVFSL